MYRVRVCNASSLEAIVGLILEDPGSRVKFIIHVCGKELKLPSEPVTTGIKIPEKAAKPTSHTDKLPGGRNDGEEARIQHNRY